MSVDAPEPSLVEALAGQSIDHMVKDGVYADFYNKNNTLLAHLAVKNDPSVYVPALRRLGSFEAGYRDVLIKRFFQAGMLNVKGPNPGTLPGGQVSRCRISPDGRFVAVSMVVSPYLRLYEIVNGALVYRSIAAAPAGLLGGLEWSADSQYLMGMTYAFVGTQGYYLWARTGTTITLQAYNTFLNPGTPAQNVNKLRWSPDNMYIALSTFGTPYFSLYKRDGASAETFTKLPDITLASQLSALSSPAWSPDMKYLAIAASGGTDQFMIFKKNGDVFTRVVGHPSLSAELPSGATIDWSPDGNYLALGCTSISSRIVVLKRSGDTFTKLGTPSGIAAIPNGLGWSADGRHLAITPATAGATPQIYRFENDTLTEITPFESPPVANLFEIQFSNDGKNMIVGHQNSPYITLYNSAQSAIPGAAVRINPESPVLG